MLQMRSIICFFTLAALVGVPKSKACTAFLLGEPENSVVGKSYDWHASHGMAMVNKRNVAKTAFVRSPENTPARWRSQYGSVTFTQFGQELPLGGINEAGLVVAILWLDEAEFPTQSAKPVLNELQWIQYILDTANDIDSVLEQAKEVDIVNIYAEVHFLACDRFAECAAFKYYEGELKVYRPDDMPTKTLTNNPYSDSLRFLRQHTGFGGTRAIPNGDKSLDRFVRAAYLTETYSETNGAARSYAFEVLNSVRSFRSRWQIVYDQQSQQIDVRLPGLFHQGHIRSIDASSFDYSCSTPVMALDLRGDATRPAWQWTSLTHNLNHRLLAIGNRSLKGAVSNEELSRLAHYPATLRCLD